VERKPHLTYLYSVSRAFVGCTLCLTNLHTCLAGHLWDTNGACGSYTHLAVFLWDANSAHGIHIGLTRSLQEGFMHLDRKYWAFV